MSVAKFFPFKASLISLFALFFFQTANAAPIYGPHTVIELGSAQQSVTPGQSFWTAARFSMDTDWHIYWQNPGDSGIPPKLKWNLPQGVTAGNIRWPAPHRISIPPLMDFGYGGTIYLPVQISVDATVPVGSTINLGLDVSWLVCQDVCIPGKGKTSIRIPVTQSADAPNNAWQKEIVHVLEKVEPQPLRDELQVQAAWLGDAVQLEISDPGKILTEDVELDFLPLIEEQLQNAFIPSNSGSLHEQVLEIPVNEQLQTAPERMAGVLLVVEKSEHLLDGGPPPKIVRSFYIAPELETSFSLWSALLFALLGGLILNLMPCVFPVLSIKVLSLVNMNEKSRGGVVGYAFAYTAGVIMSFLTLAGILLALRASGEHLGWGFQLQSAPFVVFLVFLFYLVSLNLLGWFEVGMGLTRAGGLKVLKGHSNISAFANGIFAVIVATPCTAPFMGSALGFALAQPAAISLLVFFALGLGMALPFLLLALFPAGLKILPRPGAWMETFKQALAFPMLLTGVWLLWVASLQGGSELLISVLVGLVAMSFAIWVLKLNLKKKGLGLLIGLPLLLGSLAGPIYTSVKVEPQAMAKDSLWVPYSEEAIRKANAQGTSVFVDFTAAWCLSCQVNKRVALGTDEVTAAFERTKVLRMRADWTNRDPEISKALETLGRNGVPVYAIYSPGKSQPKLLPVVLSSAIVVDALDSLTK